MEPEDKGEALLAYASQVKEELVTGQWSRMDFKAVINELCVQIIDLLTPHTCPCCGTNQYLDDLSPWCEDCSGHVGRNQALPVGQRTYQYMHGEQCPLNTYCE